MRVKRSPVRILLRSIQATIIITAFIALALLATHRLAGSSTAVGAGHSHPSSAPSAVVGATAPSQTLSGALTGAGAVPAPPASPVASPTAGVQNTSGPSTPRPQDSAPDKASNKHQPSLLDVANQPRPEQSPQATADTPAPISRGTVAPSEVLGNAALSLGGCLKEYGADGQCLPAVPPSLSQHVQEMKDAGVDPAGMPHNWQCGEVRVYFPQGITVRQPGVDPQHLDRDGDGTACGAAD